MSGDLHDYDIEMQKVDIALKYGAEGIMDLSNCGKTNLFRQKLIDKSTAMIGTVPMYDAIGYLEKDLMDITAEDFLRVVEAHAEQGVDFVTIHAGINKRVVEGFMREGRRMNIVSRGGSLLFAWMQMTGNENPFFEHYDKVLDILRKYDVTISLGDAMRPGCIDDSTDSGQIGELIELGYLTKRAWEKDVQVMIEGPGHMALNEIASNMQMEKKLCHNAPFYVLGPLVTDIAPGYDHITSAIGGAVFWWNAFIISSCFFRINCVFEHSFIINFVSAIRHFVVNFSCIRNTFCNICCVCSNFGCNQTFSHIIHIWQSQMFSWCNITQKVCTI